MHPLALPSPQITVTTIVHFLQQHYQHRPAVIAVSGGIDSAVSLSLLVQALGPQNVTALLLPYGAQSMDDALTICKAVKLDPSAIRTISITDTVDLLASTLQAQDDRRKGNIMARVRMICVYDTAKELGALVCGTENKSEHYLGYYTRYGDEASDIEPLRTLYKTQVRQLATFLELPEVFLSKAPSAGLWEQQTDEAELGFSYAQADLVIAQTLGEISIAEDVPDAVRTAVTTHLQAVAFKHQVPYLL